MANSFFAFKQFIIDQSIGGFKVTTDACILGAWAKHTQPTTILDIGTGTGLLALMLAQRYPKAQIHAVELDSLSAKQAEKNFSNSQWSKQISLFHGRIQEFGARDDKKYDLICTNPPFFKNNMAAKKESRAMAMHDKHLSWEDLADAIEKLLAPKGIAFLILPEYESTLFESLAHKKGLHSKVELIIRNFKQGSVFRRIVGYQSISETVVSESLIIRDEHNQYTKAFKTLMEDYYL